MRQEQSCLTATGFVVGLPCPLELLDTCSFTQEQLVCHIPSVPYLGMASDSSMDRLRKHVISWAFELGRSLDVI